MGLPVQLGLTSTETQADDDGFATLPLGKNGLADERDDTITDSFDFASTETEADALAIEDVEIGIIAGSSVLEDGSIRHLELSEQLPEAEADFAWTLINSTHAPEVEADPGWSWTGV
ncbi:MAG: hypothetical protein AAGD13_01085 [Pseudomonadota bacterium]